MVEDVEAVTGEATLELLAVLVLALYVGSTILDE